MKIRKKYIFISLLLILIYLFLYVNFTLKDSLLVMVGICVVIFIMYKINNNIVKDAEEPFVANVDKRNFDYLILGSTKVWEKFDLDGFEHKKIILFSFYKRSVLGCLYVLQRVYSFLSNEGTIILTIDLNQKNLIVNEKMNYSDINLLHPVTINILGLKYGNFMKTYPLLFYPCFSFGYFLHKINKKKLKNKRRNNDKIKSIRNKKSLDFTDVLLKRINSINNFCSVRDLKIKYGFIFSDLQTEGYYKIIKENLLITNQNLEIFSIKKIEDLYDVII